MLIPNSEQEADLLSALRSAAQAMLDKWPANPKASSLGLRYKPDGSMVTQGDLDSNRIVVEKLRQLFPSDKIVSEEGPIETGLALSDRVWILDPLDGTQSFVEGQEDFSILLALAQAGLLHYAVLFLPARNQLAIARRGMGAVLGERPLKVSQVTRIRPHALYLRHFKDIDDPRAYPDWLDSAEACLRLCRGEFDATVVRIKRHKQWDLAPFALLVQESGGTISDAEGKELSFGAAELNCEFFVASNGAVHQEVLQFLKRNAHFACAKDKS